VRAVPFRLVAALASGLVLVAGCGGSEPPSPSGSGGAQVAESNVDVATPELRRLRDEAGLEPCGSAEGAEGAAGAAGAEGGLPEITLPCLGGGEDVTLSALRGPLVVNLWASWCGPCREELPYYQQLHAQGAVDVLGVDYQDVLPGKALELAKETGVTYPSLADPGGELRAPLRVVGLPRLLMVDEKGKVVYDDAVAIESYAQLADLVEEHLGVPVGPRG
jgi:thiol-disulfide isomerase/thioredoxin